MGALRQNTFRTIAVPLGFVCAAALCTAASAVADTQLITNCPPITETGGVILGNTATECATGDNYQYNATPNAANFPAYPYPWDDEFYGAALIMGGMGPGRGGAR